MDKNDNFCKKCKNPCLECKTDFDGNNCLSCINGYHLLRNLSLSGATNIT